MSEDSTWDALEAASASVDRLLAADLSGVEDVMPMAEVAEELAREVAAFQQNLAAEVVAREGAEAGGPGAKQLLQARLRLSPREAKSRIERAADLAPRRALTGEALPPRLPATAAAQAEGALSVEQVQVIQATMKALPAAVDPGTWATAEGELAGHARRFDPKRLGILATRLRACLDPDGTLATELEQIERRELSFARDVDGSYFLRGRLDPEGAEVVRVALDSLAAPWPADDGTRDPRTPGRRQADALVELAQRAINGGELPDSGGRPTQLLLLANLADLQAQTGLAELSHTGSPVSVQATLRMACDAELIPTVFGDGQVLTAGRTRRLATKRQRDALIARDRGCAAPDCDAPPAWTQAHHVVHWAHGGRTDLDNLILLCGRHHRAVHTQHWTITTNTHGTPEVRPPPSGRAA